MSRELLDAWRPLLAEVGELGEAARDAIARGDIVATIAAMVRMRQARATLTTVEGAHGAAEPAAIAEVGSLAIGAQAAVATMERWLARALPGDEALLRSPLGIAVLADAMLPPVWDFASDIVVLAGDGLAPVADVLASLGQQRIVMHGTATRSLDELSAAIRTMQPCSPGRMVVRTTTGVAHDDAAAIASCVEAAISDLRIQRNTVCAFSRTWVDQGIANLPALARWPSIAAVGDRLRGKPMVLVAPGPSLATNAHLLAALKNRAVIAAFSHSLRPVLAAGVTPDLVITVDPQDLVYHFDGCDTRETYLVNAATVHPSLFALPARGFFTVAANASIDDWVFDTLGEDASAPGGGSVATTALSLALRWGCDPIVFVGLDLSYPGGRYYVDTSVDGEARAAVDDSGVVRVEGWSAGFRAMKAGGGPAAVGERRVELPGYHGGTVPSSFMFSMFHRWFVDRLAAGVPATVVNATEGGAFIPGMVHRPLADVVRDLVESRAPVDGRALLDDAVTAIDPDARREVITARLDTLVRGLRRCKKLAVRAMRLAQAPDARLEAIEARLAAELAPLRLASLLAQRDLERAHDTARRPADAATYLAASTALFDTLRAVIDRLEPATRGALAAVRRARAA